MKTVSPDYATQHFSELMQAVSAGEEILIADDSGPIARILPFGGLSQGASSSDDPDAPSDEVEQAFYGD